MVWLFFAMAFVLGPAVFFLLAQFDGRGWPLALAASLLAIGSFVLQQEAALSVTADHAVLLGSVAFIWLAWVLMVVLTVRAMRLHLPGDIARRWSRSLGAVATTIPWFGFATAQLMAA